MQVLHSCTDRITRNSHIAGDDCRGKTRSKLSPMFGGQPFYLGHLGKTPVFVSPDSILNLLLVWMWCDKTVPGFMVMLMALVTVILVHESGHALMARINGMFGITIVLAAFGGFCSYGGSRSPKTELPIALAGPAANLLTAAALWLTFRYVPHLDTLNQLIVSYLIYVMYLSLVLGLFNLLPIYPLDGGQATLAVSRMISRSETNARRFTLSLTVTAVPATLVAMHFMHFGIGVWTLAIFALLLFSAFRDLR